jgi:cytochrome oxidase Cu insertion factor (SCO1/SenC/PrrC family)
MSDAIVADWIGPMSRCACTILASVLVWQSGCKDAEESAAGAGSADAHAAVEHAPNSGNAAVTVNDPMPRDQITSGALDVLGQVPPFALTDSNGEPFHADRLAGKVAVYNFFFTRCGATCPRQSAELQKLQSQLRQTPAWEHVRLVSISVDPEFDTPAVLREYAADYSADAQNWFFLTGDREQIWKLSKKGFMLPAGDRPGEPSMPIFHSSKFVLVDEQRQIRGYYEALEEAEVERLRLGLENLAVAAASSRRAEPGGNANAGTDEPAAGGIPFQTQASQQDADVPTPDARPLYVPSESHLNPQWLDSRARAQQAAVEQSDVFHDFRFTDRLPESGITFVHEIVDDAGKTYKAAHYDHGNGLAIADVDGDGHYDVYFTTQLGSNELYHNRGDGTFENITERAGVGLAERISVSASFADVDNDGDADLFVTTVRGGNALFQNDGSGTFRDITREAGLEYTGHSSSAEFFDYDRDGLLDLFLVNVGKYTTDEVGPGNYYVAYTDAFSGHLKPERNEASILYKNLGDSRFADVTLEAGIVDQSWSGDASPLDVNEDGWPDLYVLNMQGHDEYYENVEGRRFTKRSRDVFPKTPWGAMGIKVFDFDNDGRQDIYVTDMHSDMSERIDIDREKLKANMTFPESYLESGGMSIYGNAFYRRTASGAFEEVSDAIGAENYWPWGLSVGDLNADGFEDAFVASSMNLPFRYGVNSVLLNERGVRFVDSEFVLGVEPRRDGRTCKAWFELDCDGPDRDHPYARQANIESGKVVVWGALGSRSSVVFDLDQDGDLDVVTNDFHSEPMVLVSNLSDQKEIRFLKIKLVGQKSNRDGLGAKVEVAAGGNTFTKIHDGQSGYLSQSSQPLYFGLGLSESIDAVRVYWPSGTMQEMSGPIDANRLLVIEETTGP